jgi:hypothetical protein
MRRRAQTEADLPSGKLKSSVVVEGKFPLESLENQVGCGIDREPITWSLMSMARGVP